MTLDEVYKHYKRWGRISRALDIGTSTVERWRHHGYIDIRRQHIIEYETHGELKARLCDDHLLYKKCVRKD